MPLYAYIGLSLLWIIFTMELFVVTYILQKDSLSVVLWACFKMIPLILVTFGMFNSL